MKILVVEDDRVIAGIVRAHLEAARFDVELAFDGETGLQRALTGVYGLIILDLMLPRREGLSVCEALRRRRCTVPILVLTARDAVDDRVRGLEAGADDYLPKPFDPKELLAHARALMRRDRIHRTRVIRIADLEIDTNSAIVRRAGRPVHLTPREFTLLEALASREGRLVTREEILERVWLDDESCSNTVDVHLASLRRKIDASQSPKLIQTVYGRGYTMRGPDSEAEQ
jgi:DNA-binding response OmpR family regulator